MRWRLTLWFCLVLLAILVFSGVLLNTVLQRYLFSEIDNNLQVYSARVHGTLHAETIPGPLDYNVIHDKLPAINEFSSPGIYIQIIDTTGKIVVKSDNLGSQELPVSLALIERGISGNTDIQTISAGDDAEVRIIVSPLYLEDQTLILEVAQSLKPANDAMRQLRLALIAGTLTALLLAGILAAVLVRRTLGSVERITRTAGSIEESSNLTRRVGYHGPDDEIGRLATTFDRMIERLEKVFESQKHFIADASHELRTPLTVIQGNLDLLKRNISDDDRKESLRAIEAETGRMTKIASDLLLLAELEARQTAKQDEVSLRALIMDELKRAQLLAGSRKIIPGRLDDISVKGDSYQLGQVLGNLVDNAIKYTPYDGVITLSVFKDQDWVRLEVTDNGMGIAAKDLPHLFDRFYRVDKARSRIGGGTGLGLAIVKRIVEQHGGKVTVTSEPGKGSKFTVWLRL